MCGSPLDLLRLIWLSSMAVQCGGACSTQRGRCAKTALQPFDALKTVQQGSAGSLSVAAAFAEMLKRGGPGALYSGRFVSLVGSVPSVFVYFGVYQFLKVR